MKETIIIEDTTQSTSQEKSIIKVDKVTQIEQLSCLQVEPELFEEMKTTADITVAQLNDKGYTVLLFFTSHIGCINCKGTMYDIYNLQAEFLKLNCIPVIVHEEDYDTYEKFLNSSPQTKIFSDILHMERKSFGKRFQLKESTIVDEALGVFKKGYAELFRLMKLGYKNELTYLPKGELGIILAAVFVVQNKKIISEYRKEHKYQRFDLARILIDTDGNGVDIHTSIFECEIPKKSKPKTDMLDNGESFLKRTFSLRSTDTKSFQEEKFEAPKTLRRMNSIQPVKKTFSFMKKEVKKKIEKSELESVLDNKKSLKYFKLFATKEFSVENVLFFEEVQFYKSITNESEREKRVLQMMDNFFSSDSIHEINTSKQYVEAMKGEIEKGNFSVEFFDSILTDVKRTNLSDTFQRFQLSPLYKEMKQKNKKKTYFLFQ